MEIYKTITAEHRVIETLFDIGAGRYNVRLCELLEDYGDKGKYQLLLRSDEETGKELKRARSIKKLIELKKDEEVKEEVKEIIEKKRKELEAYIKWLKKTFL
jgi:hypothetical protein